MNPLSIEDWLKRVEDKKAAAGLLIGDKRHARECWLACGAAAEFLAKAYIMKVKGLNGWPDRAGNEDLYDHRIRNLLKIAGLDFRSLTIVEQASFAKAMNYRREHDYEVTKFPWKEAKEMYAAVFGPDGVEQWLRKKIR